MMSSFFGVNFCIFFYVYKICFIKYEIFYKKLKFIFKSINVNNNLEFEFVYFLVLI